MLRKTSTSDISDGGSKNYKVIIPIEFPIAVNIVEVLVTTVPDGRWHDCFLIR